MFGNQLKPHWAAAVVPVVFSNVAVSIAAFIILLPFIIDVVQMTIFLRAVENSPSQYSV